ncbi:MAG: carbamoyl phosphate synthase small subunit [Clostridiales bacterium]|nr:carbamoyl phosphate synthase small subunit [Clostridiales bacterium]
MEQARYLILEDGRVFKGKPFGASGQVTGEIVFTTAMTGYLETLTDPSYYGQMVVQTFPLIGNYGVIPEDFEGAAPALKAYIVRNWCQEPSNFRSEEDLDAFLLSANVVGLWDVDTRELVKIIRERGVMNAVIADSPDLGERALQELRAYRIERAVEQVSCGAERTQRAEDGKRSVVLWDFGAKRNIARELLRRGCDVTSVPAGATAAEILALRPDGVMLSNGPGDPAENTGIIRELGRLCEARVPIFGICLGHQLLALAQGGRTMKLKYGHRGANQPVQERGTKRVYITSQNHGYAVMTQDALPKNAVVSFTNLNDDTCEGLDYTDLPAFSVQFHPEACAGPLDTRFLFDRFIRLMEAAQSARA